MILSSGFQNARSPRASTGSQKSALLLSCEPDNQSAARCAPRQLQQCSNTIAHEDSASVLERISELEASHAGVEYALKEMYLYVAQIDDGFTPIIAKCVDQIDRIVALLDRLTLIPRDSCETEPIGEVSWKPANSKVRSIKRTITVPGNKVGC